MDFKIGVFLRHLAKACVLETSVNGHFFLKNFPYFHIGSRTTLKTISVLQYLAEIRKFKNVATKQRLGFKLQKYSSASLHAKAVLS